MPVPIRVVLLLSLPLVRADFWDDFSNNLATDLAPLLSLFGERVTMQYMSESITFLDYFIFAMAPMGILTALVSAIRVCGSPSLRAFVGRAQEGAGNAEVELCSSTSRNVCELYNNGGITRVFGRPKILEVIHDPSGPEFLETPELLETAGIYTFQDYIKTSNGKALWKEAGARTDMESQNENVDSGPFAPNLSLNVGIKRKPDAVFWGVAVFGAVLQLGVLVYSGIITYYLQWESETSSSVQYACPLTIVGTLLVCSGVFYCAYLVGESTSEQVYCRSSLSDESTPAKGTETAVPALYWLQPGGQVLGDQTFDAFGYSDRDQPLQKYLISWKRRSEEQKHKIWMAVIMTTVGFVMQFIGLRGIHPTASIAQLGAIIVMSAARASLRMQRLKPRDNILVDCPDDVVGYELDWLALCIGRDDIRSELKLQRQDASSNLTEDRREFWEFCGTSRCFVNDEPSFVNPKLNAAWKLLAYRVRLAELTESTNTGLNQASSARQFRDNMVKVRSVARQLSQALESAAAVIASKTSGFKDGYHNTIWWEVDCSVATRVKSDQYRNDPSSPKTFPVRIRLDGNSPWKLYKPLEIEAILGLWIWSLVSDFSMEMHDKYDNVRISRAFEVPIRRIISAGTYYETMRTMRWSYTKIHDLYQDAFEYKDVQSTRLASVFTLKPSGDKYIDEHICEPLVSDLPRDLWSDYRSSIKYMKSDYRSRVVRYFGWHNIETHQTGDMDSGSSKMKVFSISGESLEYSCAQELFGSFVKSLLSQVSDIGHITVEKGLRGQDFYLSNSVLNDLIEIFVRSGLGSKEDALPCVLPAMSPYLRNLPMEVAFQIAMATLKKHQDAKYRKDRKLTSEGAELLLEWAWNFCKQPPGEGEVQLKEYSRLCAMTLGELHRSLLIDSESSWYGKGGIERLLEAGQDQSEGCQETIQYYGSFLKEFMKMEKGRREDPWVGNNSNSISALLSLTQPSNRLARAQKGPDLCEAASLGWAEVVLASLASGSDPDLAGEGIRSQTPLHHAAKNGHANVVDILIGLGASQYRRNPDGFSALDLAVLNGHHVVVKSLLDAYDRKLVSDCRGTNNRGKTTLHIAVEQEDEGMIKVLLDSGKFDLESRDDDGNTPLHIAADRLGEVPVELLVDTHECRTETENDDSRNPVAMAIHNGQKETLKMFFNVYQVDPEIRDYYGSTPLHMAVYCRQEGIIKLLIDTYHVDPNSKDYAKMTPLHVAIKCGWNEAAKLLLGVYHVDCESKDYKEFTPLHWAAKCPDGEIARLLIETYNVNPHPRASGLIFPLQCAILAENFDLVEYMVNLIDKYWIASEALFLARKLGHDNIIDLLSEKEEQMRDIEINNRTKRTRK